MSRQSALKRTLGAAVKARREELGLTQEQMELESGRAQRWISNVENGWRDIRYMSLRRLAASLGLKASELLARIEEIEAGLPEGERLDLEADIEGEDE